MRIGVLSIQGGVTEHIKHLKALGVETVEVKFSSDLEYLDGLILPGGESTAISKILKERNMLNILRNKILSGLPVWGTCAGMILLSKELYDSSVSNIGVMDIKVKRNAYGRQIDSFETHDVILDISDSPIPLVFIRAPYIVDVGDTVEILLEINGNIVAAKQNNMLATSFHPELTNNLEFHKYFLKMCKEKYVSH
jgi:5'-phosphate synthase pdxT subunit